MAGRAACFLACVGAAVMWIEYRSAVPWYASCWQIARGWYRLWTSTKTVPHPEGHRERFQNFQTHHRRRPGRQRYSGVAAQCGRLGFHRAGGGFPDPAFEAPVPWPAELGLDNTLGM
jgi:hypothetical protein